MSANARFRICPLCVAACGLAIEINSREAVSARRSKRSGRSTSTV